MAKGLALIFHKEEDSGLFEKIILALKNRYLLVSANQLEQLIREGKSTKNVCHITFDDGLKSFFTVIFPLLKKHHVPASLFVSPEIIRSGDNFWFQEMEGYDEAILKNIMATQLNVSLDKLTGYTSQTIFKCLPIGRIQKIIELYQQQTKCGKKVPQNMTVEQLREVDTSGLVNVGAHTMNHPVLKNEDDESCFFEITESVNALEKLLGRPVRYFAYPNGRPGIDFGEREKDYLRKSNIAMAFSTELDTLSSKNSLLNIPRMGFARMGLSPSNPFINLRLSMGKKWINLKAIGKPGEREVREQIRKILVN